MKLSKVLTILTPLMLVVGAVWAANEVMSADHPLKIMCQAMMTTALSVGAIGLVVWAGLYSLSAVFRYIGRHFDPIECNTNKS